MFSGMGNTLRMSIWLFCRWGCERLAHRCISIIEWNICSKAASFHVLTSLLCFIKIDLSFLKKNEADQTRNLRSACLSLRRKEKKEKDCQCHLQCRKKNINELLVTRMEGQNMGDSHLFTCQLDTYFSRLLMTN